MRARVPIQDQSSERAKCLTEHTGLFAKKTAGELLLRQSPAKGDEVGYLFDQYRVDQSYSSFSFLSTFNTALPCAKLALRSCSGTFL